MKPGQDRIIFPLDVQTTDEAHKWCQTLEHHVGVMKVGLELFTALGPSVLDIPRRFGHGIFLDLKLHDIPATVGQAARAAANHGIDFLTVHASGGPAMLAAAVRGAQEGALRVEPSPPIVLAVTVLTSMSPNDLKVVFGTSLDIPTVVQNMARTAWDAGVRGFVCSPLEVGILRELLGPQAILVVPGVRPAGTDAGDQKRIATPAQAMKDGANYLVVGRPIRESADPVEATLAIAHEIRQYV